MKRKDVDQVSDDFSDFSLSSPARKIRRLDAELPPIMEDLEEEAPVFGRPIAVPGRVEIEKLDVGENPERAIVLFKPVGAHNPLLYSPSGFSVALDSGFLSELKSKNQYLWSDKKLYEGEDGENDIAAKDCMAVVPWVPSQFPHPTDGVQTELMEAEYVEGEATMDIEDNRGQSLVSTQDFELGLPQWQQQHCMTPPQLPQNNPTPVTWFQ